MFIRAGILAVLAAAALAQTRGPSGLAPLQRAGAVNLGAIAQSAGAIPGIGPNEFRSGADQDVVNRKIPHASFSTARSAADHVPAPAASALAESNPGFFGFNGVSHLDQRAAGTGAFSNTQFSLEPPDQGLCVGNGFVLETINTALRVFSASSGAPLSPPVALNQFYQLAPEVVRSTPPVYGDFTSDPKCYFDAPSQRFFMTLLQIDTDPATGNLASRSALLLAVTQTGSPLGGWNLYRIDVTNDGKGGTPSHPLCPCFGDQPLIGADANGFYITTNEFPITGPGFNGAQIYAISKAALAAGASPPVFLFSPGALADGISYSVQPATTPPGGAFAGAANGTEYFLSALEFFGVLDNRIAVWAMTNTASLNTASPALTLRNIILASEEYLFPPAAEQPDGPRPLADLLTSAEHPKEKLELVDTNDDRMNAVVYANGKLWGAVDTVVKTANGPVHAGIAYFIVSPSLSGGVLTASMVNQGYVALNQASVAYPTIGVNNGGKGVMVFTLTSPDRFPSAAYVPIDAVNGAGDVHIAAPGVFPEDGITGYFAFQGAGRLSRWGDYSAAVADEAGNIWTAVEYIPGAPRSALANWGTFVSRIVP